MKSPYISDLKPNQVITTTFLVHVKDVRQKKSGDPYLSLLLGDRTGEIDAKMWDNVADVMETFERDDFVKVKGLLQVFQNRLQLTIHKMSRVLDGDVDFADYFPASDRDPGEMFRELRAIVDGMANTHLRALLDAFLEDEPLAHKYRIAPAAKHVHHAYLGGLIEHVLSLCTLSRMMASHYKYIDLDLLLTGAILHDVGKIAELTYDRSFGYSSEGQLIGHIAIGLRMLHEKLARFPEFPPKLRVLVEHMILSHHGELEFGSPKVPQFAEALLLHHLDNLDSKMECVRALVAKDRLVDGHWTGYNPSLDRSILKMAKFLEEEREEKSPAVEVAEAPAAPQSVASVAPAPPTPAAAPAPKTPAAALASKPPAEPPKPQSNTHFAEKLQEAWRKSP
jgi:3'-5' exoribonuclease